LVVGIVVLVPMVKRQFAALMASEADEPREALSAHLDVLRSHGRQQPRLGQGLLRFL